MREIIDIIGQMKSDTLHNYVVAGLDSSLLNNGLVRYFECGREHQDQITPHSHRFDFACLVLAGEVENHIWSKTHSKGDDFMKSELEYFGVVGSHTKKEIEVGRYSRKTHKYSAGDIYGMTANEIHSITFSRGAKVLFFQGREKSNTSVIIEPYVNNQVINTYERKDYMFIRDEPIKPLEE